VFSTLIVEDNAAFRQSLSVLLRTNYPAMSVAQAENISEAWKKIAENQPGLVFVDIKLQEENGLDLAKGVRNAHPDVIVAVITGFNLPEYRQAAYHNGAHFFVPKDSFTSADILTLVDAIQTGQPPQWRLGLDYINPSSHFRVSGK